MLGAGGCCDRSSAVGFSVSFAAEGADHLGHPSVAGIAGTPHPCGEVSALTAAGSAIKRGV